MNGTDDPANGATHHTVLIDLIPFLIAVPALILSYVLWELPLPKEGTVLFFLFSTLWVIAVVDLSVCVIVLVEWLRTGKPPDLSLSPLFLTLGEREFRWKLRHRPKRNDDEFYEAFYADSVIPKYLPVELRRMLDRAMGLNFAALWPSDNLIDADSELDWTDVFYRVEREFKVAMPRERWGEFEGTFDSLLKMIVAGKEIRNSSQKSSDG